MRKKTIVALFAVVFMLMAGTSLAQITQGTIGNGTYVDWEGHSSQAYGIDFNNDGYLEFRISDGSSSNDYIVYVWSDGGNNVYNSSIGWDYAAALTQGTAIGPAGNWEGQGDCMVNETYPSRYFIGFRFKNGSDIHYGWAMVNVSASAVNWVKAYYQATPSTPINAGDEGSAAVAMAENNCEISCVGNRTIRICAASDEQFRIYDLAGRNLSTLRGSGTATMPGKGVYVVKSGNVSRKIVVF